MASTKRYLDHILDRLKLIDGVSYEEYQGNYLLCASNVMFGVIIDDQFLVKKTKRSRGMVPYAREIVPFDEDKYLHITEIGNRIVVKELVKVIIDDLKNI